MALLILSLSSYAQTEGDTSSKRIDEIAVIEGRSISYREFMSIVDQASEQARLQYNQRELDEATIFSIREQVWNDFITQAIIDRAVKDFGISVADEEIMVWLRGDNPPEKLTKYFRDSSGTLNRELYLQFLDNPGAENQIALIQIEKQLKEDIVRKKLTDRLLASVSLSDEKLRSLYADENTESEIKYIFFDPRIIAAKDTGKPSQDELEVFYTNHKEMFKVKESRQLKFILFRNTPSSMDTAAVRKHALDLMESVENGEDFLELLEKNLKQQYKDRFMSVTQFPPNVVDSLLHKSAGSVFGPVINEFVLSIYKIMNVRRGEELCKKASHILFRTDNGQNEDVQKKKAIDTISSTSLAKRRGWGMSS